MATTRKVYIDSHPITLGVATPAVLTDSTGGTVSTTLATGITDAVAKNAIASLNAQINALRTALIASGLVS